MQKRCIVTGSASGIGQATVKQLVQQGLQVVGIDKQTPSAENGAVKNLVADLTDSRQAEAAFASAVEVLGGLDVAANVAGYFGTLAAVHQISDEKLDAVTFANIRMCLHSMRAELRHMLKNGGGRIVNVASVAGSYGIVLKGDYCAAKHAILGLTKSAALETAKSGICINSVSPGFVDTPMTTTAIAENPLLGSFIEKQTPTGKCVEAASVARMIVWLATEAPGEISGSDFVIDGTYSAR